MQTLLRDSSPRGLELKDILFVLFTHKWKVLACTMLGLAGALFFSIHDSGKEFQAKLLVRYVVDRSAIDPVDPQVKTVNSSGNSDNVINSEVEILTSADLADQVARAVGVDRLAARDTKGSKEAAAARRVSAGLKVNALKGSNVILISYADRDPKLAKQVLDELVSRYFDKHMQVHRSLGTFEFVSKQSDQVRDQLRHTEESLRDLKIKAGVSSLADMSESIASALKKTSEELHAARVELAERRARVAEIGKVLANPQPSVSLVGSPANDGSLLRQYEDLSADITRLRQEELNLLSKYTPESRAVQIRQAQIAELEARRRAIEQKSPAIATMRMAKGGGALAPSLDMIAETVQLAATEAKTKALELQLRDIETKAVRMANIGTQISQLERNKEMEEANYKYFKASLEKARVDEALDPSKIPNISVVQTPSPAPIKPAKYLKAALAIALGGLGTGIALAFLIELVIDPSVKLPRDLERYCQIYPMVSIPDADRNGRHALPGPHTNGGGAMSRLPLANTEIVRTLHPFFAAVRDRLALFFELNGISKKPKLVAVAGLSQGAGVSTIAAGLASALAEAGDGTVLLVDMNGMGANDDRGRQVRSLTEALRSNGTARSGDKLHLAAGAGLDTNAGRIVLKKFYDLMPDLKASDFDYIIFDMPPIDQTSITPAMAGLMDKFLLVVQAERDDREVVQRAYNELVSSKGDVSVVLNKFRIRTPDWVHAGV